jgi:hypothetical protein
MDQGHTGITADSLGEQGGGKIVYSFKPLEPSGHYMYQQVYNSNIPRSAHTVYLCALCGSTLGGGVCQMF